MSNNYLAAVDNISKQPNQRAASDGDRLLINAHLKESFSERSGAETVKTRIYKENTPFLIVYALIASMGMFQLGYVYTATNQTAAVLDVQFDLKYSD
jgi:hypothetical protein